MRKNKHTQNFKQKKIEILRCITVPSKSKHVRTDNLPSKLFGVFLTFTDKQHSFSFTYHRIVISSSIKLKRYIYD